MADASLGYTPGSGAQVATDQDGNGRHHQKALVEYLNGEGAPTPVAPTAPFPVHDEDLVFLIQRLLNAIGSPPGYDRSQQRQRVVAALEASQTLATVTTVTTVSTVTAVSSVSNIAAIDGLQPRISIYGANLSAWKDTVRSLIT